MKPGLESQTSVMACMGRALADGAPWAEGFADPTALALLPDDARAIDGRAWRLDTLRDVRVFEVDHPDTQREKRARVAALIPVARSVALVPVDFAQKSELDAALAAQGHDPALPTTWIWEGVVMYLSQPDIEATLGVVQRRSAPASRLIVTSVVAQMLEANPALTPREVKRILIRTARRLPNLEVDRQGWGAVQPRDAVDAALALGA